MLLTFASGQHCAFSSCAHATWAFPFERIELYGDHAQIVTEEMEEVAYAPGLGRAIVRHDFFSSAYRTNGAIERKTGCLSDAILEGKRPGDGARTVTKPLSW